MATDEPKPAPRGLVLLLGAAIAWSALAVHPQGSEAWKAAGLAAFAAIALAWHGLPPARRTWPLYAIAAAGCLSAAGALEPLAALAGSQARALGLASVLAGVVLAAHASKLGPDARRALLAGLACIGGIVAIHALLQRAGLDPWQWHGADATRPASALGNATTLAGWLLLALPPTLALAWCRRHALWTGLAVLQAAALLASGTRSAWLGLAAAALCLWVHASGWRRAALPVLGVVALGLLALAWRPGSLLDRVHLWAAAAQAWQSPAELPDLDGRSDALRAWRPLLGHGPDQQRAALDPRLAGAPAARPEAVGLEADRAHQGVLDLLLQYGVLGLAALCWLAAALWHALRRAPAGAEEGLQARALALALGAWLLHQQFAFALNADQALALLLAGLVLAGPDAREAAPRPWPRWPPAALLVLVSVAIFANGRWPWTETLAPALAAERAFARGQQSYAAALASPTERSLHLRQAADAFEHAVRLRRRDRDAALAAASAWVELAASAADASALARARQRVDAVAAMTPADPRLPGLRARIEDVASVPTRMRSD